MFQLYILALAVWVTQWCYFYFCYRFTTYYIYYFQDASSSDSDLLRSSPVWPPRPRSPSGSNSMNNNAPAARVRPAPIDANLSDSTRSISSQEAEDQVKCKNAFILCI